MARNEASEVIRKQTMKGLVTRLRSLHFILKNKKGVTGVF